MAEESYYKYKTSCDACGSSDANAVYSNGSTYCFSCQTYVKSPETIGSPSESGADLSKFTWGEYRAIPDRCLDEDTCRKYGYQVNDLMDENGDVHIAPYYDLDGTLVKQHLRYTADKKHMPFRGSNAKQIQMFGQNKFSAGASDKLFICEGEIDTLSVYQAMGKSWAAVGIPGADTVEKAIKNNLEFIESFNEVILFFDNDEAGRKATQTALDILPFGKVKYINEFPPECKDANDILVKKGPKLLRETCFYKAAEFIPDGVVAASDIEFEPDSFDVSMYPWQSWNKKLYARRGGELSVYTAGTGIGKSTILRHIYSDLIKQGEKCAVIMLEETVAETKADLMSQVLGKPIRKILAQCAVNDALAKKGRPPLFPDVEPLTPEELLSCEKEVNDSGLLFIDHSKGYNLKSITSQIRFLAKSKGIRHILLDHITLLIGSDGEIDNEVKALDVAMKEFRVLCEETGINLDMISHIRKRGSGAKSVNSGAPISMEELRGSGSLTQIANNVITLERDQQDPDDRNLTVCRSLKSRLGGFTGEIGRLRYNPETGDLTEEEKDTDAGFSDQTSADY